MLEFDKFTTINNDGIEIEYNVISTFKSEDTKKKYIIYTENIKNNNEEVKIFASTYTINNGTLDLKEIETEKEWKVINTILKSIYDNLK